MDQNVIAAIGRPLTARNANWRNVAFTAPPFDTVIETKIDDGFGVREFSRLRYLGPIWVHEDGYTLALHHPTHWRPAR